MPYKDKERERESARLRKQKQRAKNVTLSRPKSTTVVGVTPKSTMSRPRVIIQDVTPAINSEAPRTRAEALKVLPIERVEAIDRVLEGRARIDLFDDQDERWWRAIDYHKWNEARVNNIVGPFTKYVLRDKVHSKRTVLSKKT